MENKSEFYYEQLEDTMTPGKVIAQYYCALYGIDCTKSEQMMFNRLVTIFGRFTVFFAVQGMIGTYPKLQDNVFPLLHAICTRRFEEAHSEDSLQSRQSLVKYATQILKDIEEQKKRKIDIPSSEGLEWNG